MNLHCSFNVFEYSLSEWKIKFCRIKRNLKKKLPRISIIKFGNIQKHAVCKIGCISFKEENCNWIYFISSKIIRDYPIKKIGLIFRKIIDTFYLAIKTIGRIYLHDYPFNCIWPGLSCKRKVIRKKTITLRSSLTQYMQISNFSIVKECMNEIIRKGANQFLSTFYELKCSAIHVNKIWSRQFLNGLKFVYRFCDEFKFRFHLNHVLSACFCFWSIWCPKVTLGRCSYLSEWPLI